MKLPERFYRRKDVLKISRELLGKLLCSRQDGVECKVLITETEAYAGISDRASHAYAGRRTARTEIMYGDGGLAYVYLCYGIHHLFNVVTNVAGIPHAVLIRAALPYGGLTTLQKRRGRDEAGPKLMPGPGTVAQALGITTELSGATLQGSQVWIEDAGVKVPSSQIQAGPRIGVDYAGEDAGLPYRYVWSGTSGVAVRPCRADSA
ncbi:MAG: DNA-3-methyladenine glycosylase [Woeseia sp.]